MVQGAQTQTQTQTQTHTKATEGSTKSRDVCPRIAILDQENVFEYLAASDLPRLWKELGGLGKRRDPECQVRSLLSMYLTPQKNATVTEKKQQLGYLGRHTLSPANMG